MAYPSGLVGLTFGCVMALTAGSALAGDDAAPKDAQPNFSDNWAGGYAGINGGGGSKAGAVLDPNSPTKSKDGDSAEDLAGSDAGTGKTGRFEIEIGGQVDK